MTYPKTRLQRPNCLASLSEKDETLCIYPGCSEERVPATGTGRPPEYCDNPKHTAVNAHRARLSLQKIVAGPEPTSKRETSSRIVATESMRDSLVSEMLHMQESIERGVDTLTRIADPDQAIAREQEIKDRADVKIAEVQQAMSTERSLRLAAEASATASRKEAQVERDAAGEAIIAMEEAEARAQRIEKETTQQIDDLLAEHALDMEGMKTVGLEREEKIRKDAQHALADMEIVVLEAREEADQAHSLAHDIELKASAHVAAAEQLVAEAQSTLTREREEVDRLRTELATIRKQSESDRTEARATLDREREEARVTLKREQDEVGRLRSEMVTMRTQYEQDRAEDRKTLDRERKEVDRLQQEVADTQFQIDELEETAKTDRAEARATLEREQKEVDRLAEALTIVQKKADQLVDANEKLQTQIRAARKEK